METKNEIEVNTNLMERVEVEDSEDCVFHHWPPGDDLACGRRGCGARAVARSQAQNQDGAEICTLCHCSRFDADWPVCTVVLSCEVVLVYVL